MGDTPPQPPISNEEVQKLCKEPPDETKVRNLTSKLSLTKFLGFSLPTNNVPHQRPQNQSSVLYRSLGNASFAKI